MDDNDKYAPCPNAQKLAYEDAKKDLKDIKSNTQLGGWVTGKFLFLSAAFADTALSTKDDLPTFPYAEAIPPSLTAASVICLYPAYKTVREFRNASSKEFAKGLTVPLLILPLVLDYIEPHQHDKDDPYGFNHPKKDNIYYRGYQVVDNKYDISHKIATGYNTIEDVVKDFDFSLPD